LALVGTLKEGYHTYPVTVRTKEQSGGNTTLTFTGDAVTPLGSPLESEPEAIDEGPDAGGINLEHEKPFTWTQEFLVKPDATPGVFPMIPITVSFFIKQAEQKHNSPVLLATVYSATIVFVLTLGGLLLSTVLAQVSQHYLTNLVLGLLFLFFALSLFGMYEIM